MTAPEPRDVPSSSPAQELDVAALAADVLAKGEAATPRPWEHFRRPDVEGQWAMTVLHIPDNESGFLGEVMYPSDAALIVAAVNAAPVLAQAVLDRDADIERLGSVVARLRAAGRHLQSGRDEQQRRAEAAEARLARVEALVDDWEAFAGPDSENWRVFGPQDMSVPFVVKQIRRALADPDPAAPTQPAERETCPPHDPQYARSECGVCGQQESWCSRCSERLCGCQPAERKGGAWDMRGGPLWLDREQWGVIIDALIQHAEHAEGRKLVNPESTSDVRAQMCLNLVQRINSAAEADGQGREGER